MVSEIQGVKGANAPTPIKSAPPAEAAVPAQTAAKAALAVPKPAAIKFDSGEMRQNLQDAVKMLNEQMSVNKQGLGFSFDETANRAVVTVRNINSGEVVRQIPNEDLLHLAHKLDDLKGILFNNKV